MGVLRWESGGTVSLLWALKDMLRKALETAICLHRGPAGEPGGVRLLVTLRVSK